jgi:hypothetical protein
LATDPGPQGQGTHSGAAGAAAGAGVVGLLGVLSLAAIAIALFMVQRSMGEQNCIRKAEAQWPTVPVSAFVGNDRSQTGPLKVSFSEEREAAVKAC